MRFLIDRNDTCNSHEIKEINLNLVLLLIINLNLLFWVLVLISYYKSKINKVINYIKGTSTENNGSYLEFINIV